MAVCKASKKNNGRMAFVFINCWPTLATDKRLKIWNIIPFGGIQTPALLSAICAWKLSGRLLEKPMAGAIFSTARGLAQAIAAVRRLHELRYPCT